MRGKNETDFRESLAGDGPYTLLTLAVKYAWLPVVCLLLRHGYNPNHYDLYDLILDIKHSIGELDSQFRDFVQCLVAAGYKFKSSSHVKLDCLLLPPHKGFTEELIEWIKEQDTLPTLQQLCRTLIRKCLRIHCKHGSIICNVSKLQLPSYLQDYIAMHGISNILVETSLNIAVALDKEPLYFAMPKNVKKHRTKREVYQEFWKQSCVCVK